MPAFDAAGVTSTSAPVAASVTTSLGVPCSPDLPLCAVVTRPAGQSAHWVAQLRAHGVPAAALPLIDIAPPADRAAVAVAWSRLGDQRLVFFVSPTAVEAFFGSASASGWPPTAIAAASGPGTSRALRLAGVPAACIAEPPEDAAQFDSEALWAALMGEADNADGSLSIEVGGAPAGGAAARIGRPGGAAAWRGASVLIVRGEGGRDWLAAQLREVGARVATVDAYRRLSPVVAPGGDADRLLHAIAAAPADHCWVFSSSQAIDHLRALRPALPWSAMQAVATHPRIADRAVQAGIGRIVDSRPTVAAVVAALGRVRQAIAGVGLPAVPPVSAPQGSGHSLQSSPQ